MGGEGWGDQAGIGEVCARALHRRGGNVVLLCRDADKAGRLVHQLGSRARAVECDTGRLASVRKAAEEVLRRCPRVDCLLLNAGQGGQARRTETEDGLERVMAVNYFGHFLLTELLLPRLRQSRPARVVSVRWAREVE